MDKTADEFKPLFTIGYSGLKVSNFLSLLKRNAIETVADVRSSPYSRFYPEFNTEGLKHTLKAHGIKYAFLGKELGVEDQKRNATWMERCLMIWSLRLKLSKVEYNV